MEPVLKSTDILPPRVEKLSGLAELRRNIRRIHEQLAFVAHVLKRRVAEILACKRHGLYNSVRLVRSEIPREMVSVRRRVALVSVKRSSADVGSGVLSPGGRHGNIVSAEHYVFAALAEGVPQEHYPGKQLRRRHDVIYKIGEIKTVEHCVHRRVEYPLYRVGDEIVLRDLLHDPTALCVGQGQGRLSFHYVTSLSICAAAFFSVSFGSTMLRCGSLS